MIMCVCKRGGWERTQSLMRKEQPIYTWVKIEMGMGPNRLGE